VPSYLLILAVTVTTVVLMIIAAAMLALTYVFAGLLHLPKMLREPPEKDPGAGHGRGGPPK
jgi:hypothetical protein